MKCAANVPVLARPALALASGSVDVLQSWLSGRNPQTLLAYRKDLDDFAAFLGVGSAGSAVDGLLTLDQGQANGVALRYRNSLEARGLAPATVARRLAALRSLVKLARMLGRVAWSLDIESPRAEKLRETSGPGLEGWKAILEAAKRRAAAGEALALRDLALIRLLHDLGLRRGEVSRLAWEDYDAQAGRLRVLGKGRREREWLTVPGPARRDLDAWARVRGSAPGALFPRLDPAGQASQGEAAADGLGGEAIRRIVAKLAKLAGIQKVVRPHGLRHQAITAVLDRNGGDLRAAAKFSRHRDLNTLTRYDDNRRDLAGAMAGLISED